MRHKTGEKTGHGAPARNSGRPERDPGIRRLRGLLECAFFDSLCYYAGHFKKAATLFFARQRAESGGRNA